MLKVLDVCTFHVFYVSSQGEEEKEEAGAGWAKKEMVEAGCQVKSTGHGEGGDCE